MAKGEEVTAIHISATEEGDFGYRVS